MRRLFLKLFKHLPRLCETSQKRRSFSVTATQAFDAVAFPWRSKQTRRSSSVKGTSIRYCSVAMAFFVIPDTPYVWRVKHCHGIQMYLRRTFLIHSGSDAIECHFIFVIAVCRTCIMQTPEIRYRNVTHTPHTSQAYNFHIFAIDMQI